MCSDKRCRYVTYPIRYRPCNQPEDLCWPCRRCESFLCAVKLTQVPHLKVSSNVMEGALFMRPQGMCLLCPSQHPSCPWTLSQGSRPSWRPLYFAFPPGNTAWESVCGAPAWQVTLSCGIQQHHADLSCKASSVQHGMEGVLLDLRGPLGPSFGEEKKTRKMECVE